MIKDDYMVLVTYIDEDTKIRCVSHGIGNNTFRNYTVSQDPLATYRQMDTYFRDKYTNDHCIWLGDKS